MSAVGFDVGVDPRVAERRVVSAHFYPVERFAADNSSASTVIEGEPVDRQPPFAFLPLEDLQRKTGATHLSGSLSKIAPHPLCP